MTRIKSERENITVTNYQGPLPYNPVIFLFYPQVMSKPVVSIIPSKKGVFNYFVTNSFFPKNYSSTSF
jgi:hypothetical protein